MYASSLYPLFVFKDYYMPVTSPQQTLRLQIPSSPSCANWSRIGLLGLCQPTILPALKIMIVTHGLDGRYLGDDPLRLPRFKPENGAGEACE
jgi:hypothetical protein